MKKNGWTFAMLALVFASLACSLFSGGSEVAPTAPASGGKSTGGLATIEAAGTSTAAASEAVEATQVPEAQKIDSEFPMPADVSNFMDLGNDSINFQTKMSITDAVAFYRDAFDKAGYKEREITTSITETAFSLVFDGHANGKAIVVQGVDLGGGNTNVNIRFEDI